MNNPEKYFGAPEHESILNQYWDPTNKLFIDPSSDAAALTNGVITPEAYQYLDMLKEGNQA